MKHDVILHYKTQISKNDSTTETNKDNHRSKKFKTLKLPFTPIFLTKFK